MKGVRITEDEAARGIYLDFEGFRRGTPSMAGTLIEDDYVCSWLHPTFAPVATATGAPFTSLEDLIATLVRKAVREERLLFAYSIHEPEVIVRHVPHYADDVADRFRNAHSLVRRWANGIGVKIPRGSRSLKTYYEAFFEPYPERFAETSVPVKLRGIAAQCKRGDWTKAPRRTRQLLVDLLDYNRLDCTATRLLVLRVARETA